MKRDRSRRVWLVAIGLLVAWAGWRATAGRDVANPGGWPSFRRFWRAIASPETDALSRYSASAAPKAESLRKARTSISLARKN